MAEIGTFLASGSSRRHPAERPHAIVTVVDARSLTLSPRSLAAGGVEVTDRATGDRRVLGVDEVAPSIS